MGKDWFSAFAEKRDTTLSKYGATGVTSATDLQKSQKTAISVGSKLVALDEALGATGATNSDPVALVTHLLHQGPKGGKSEETAENLDCLASVALVTPVAPDLCEESFDPGVPSGLAINGDIKTIAWINANPPDLPMHQNHCAACGEYIPVYDTGWVYLGDGALVHHGGERGRECFDRWQVLRRAEALKGLGESERRRPHAAPVTATAD
jgi:hypothetical protein